MKKRLPFDIIFENGEVIVIDKPCGILSVPTRLDKRRAREEQRTCETLLCDYVRKGQAKSRLRVYPVHRLDRETSGILLFAKDEALAKYLRENWNRLAHKIYIAQVEGVLEEDGGTIESYLREDPKTLRVYSVKSAEYGAYARTEWRLLAVGNGVTKVEIDLKTGKKNQIRVHFSEMGHPVAGDVKYGGRKARRLFLHASKLSVELPSGKYEWTSRPDF